MVTDHCFRRDKKMHLMHLILGNYISTDYSLESCNCLKTTRPESELRMSQT